MLKGFLPFFFYSLPLFCTSRLFLQCGFLGFEIYVDIDRFIGFSKREVLYEEKLKLILQPNVNAFVGVWEILILFNLRVQL